MTRSDGFLYDGVVGREYVGAGQVSKRFIFDGK